MQQRQKNLFSNNCLWPKPHTAAQHSSSFSTKQVITPRNLMFQCIPYSYQHCNTNSRYLIPANDKEMMCSNKAGFSSPQKKYTYIQIRSGRQTANQIQLKLLHTIGNSTHGQRSTYIQISTTTGHTYSSVYASPDSLPRGPLVARPCSQFIQDPGKGV